MPSPKPRFSHSLATTVFDADAAIIEDRESDKDVSGNERQNWEVRGMFLSMQLTSALQHLSREPSIHLPPFENLSIQTREPPTEITLKFGDKCLLLIGRHAEDRLHEYGFNLGG